MYQLPEQTRHIELYIVIYFLQIQHTHCIIVVFYLHKKEVPKTHKNWIFLLQPSSLAPVTITLVMHQANWCKTYFRGWSTTTYSLWWRSKCIRDLNISGYTQYTPSTFIIHSRTWICCIAFTGYDAQMFLLHASMMENVIHKLKHALSCMHIVWIWLHTLCIKRGYVWSICIVWR